MTEAGPDPETALDHVTSLLPGGGERRPGQVEMLHAVAEAIEARRHLVVQAGTGTGKSLAYLIPAVLSGKKAFVSTATKALQDQLANQDLPLLTEHLGIDIDFTVLKGRSNYLCRQRIDELSGDDDQLALEGITSGTVGDQIDALVAWADETATGDRAELSFEPLSAAWEAVSVGLRECPGATRCPSGDECFAEFARYRADEADVVVVNTHLYGVHLASDNTVLPEHDVVIIDEAHQLEDIISATAGATIGSGRFAALAQAVRAIVEDPALTAELEEMGAVLDRDLDANEGRRISGMKAPDIFSSLALARGRLEAALKALRSVPEGSSTDVEARKQRALQAVTTLIGDIDLVLAEREGTVAWVESGPGTSCALRVAPIDVGELLDEQLWTDGVAVLTSATIPTTLPETLGMPEGRYEAIDVGSPFDFEQSLLYCATSIPDPRHDGYEAAMLAELESLIIAAGGRTLALFTSWRAMEAAHGHLDGRLPWTLLTQRDLPKAALIEAFRDEPESTLLATMSFWQGVDIPGPSLSLVTIDRLPFPRPDDPLLQARRDRARADAFRLVDLPRAATLLAQGAGRLIRRTTDRGVVAVLDSRLATGKRYRWDLVSALPAFRRTSDRAEVIGYLNQIRDAEP